LKKQSIIKQPKWWSAQLQCTLYSYCMVPRLLPSICLFRTVHKSGRSLKMRLCYVRCCMALCTS